VGILKIPGLASGLDTENLISTLMSIEKRPMQALQTKSTSMTTEANAWRDLNQRLLTLQKRVEDLKNLSDADWLSRKTSISDSSVLTVSAVGSTAQPGSYAVEVVTLATGTTFHSGMINDGTNPLPAIDTADKDLNMKGVIKVSGGPKDGKTFTIAETDSLNDIAKTINSKSDELGFTASVMQLSTGDYRLVIKGTNGAANNFSLVDGDADQAATKLGLTDAKNQQRVNAANGTIKVNGITVTIADNVVKDAIGGTTMTVSKVGTSTVTVSKDYGKAADALKKVVDQYNTVMDFIGTLTAYDDKTKATGTLFGNDRVRQIQDAIRVRLFDNVKIGPADGDVMNLTALGVGTEKFKSGEKMSTKLVFDVDQFNKAMDKDPLQVQKLFDATGDTQGKQGVAVRLASYLDNYTRTDGILAGEAKALDKSIDLIKKRITWYQEQELPAKEAQLRKQFLNLEKAMSTFQNQGNWLSGQIKSLSSNSQ
jgi:flagellar hook-associated protein 2